MRVMRRVRFHENVVGLVGACTETPNLAIVAEYFPLGSLDKMLSVPSFELDLRRFICKLVMCVCMYACMRVWRVRV